MLESRRFPFNVRPIIHRTVHKVQSLPTLAKRIFIIPDMNRSEIDGTLENFNEILVVLQNKA